MGTCHRIKEDNDEIDKIRQIYLAKHPGAFWVEFGDFFFYRMQIEAIRFVGGFARAGSVTPEDYRSASPDPVRCRGFTFVFFVSFSISQLISCFFVSRYNQTFILN